MSRLLLSLISVAVLQIAGTFFTYWNTDAGIDTGDLLSLCVRVFFMQQFYSTLFLALYVLCLYAVIQARGQKLELMRQLKGPGVPPKVRLTPK